MQVAPPAVPRPTAATPARDVVRPRLSPDVRDLVPDVALDARIGRGTVASEFDRALSVRIEGDGPASQRRIVPQTTTAERVLASPAGPAFERLVRRTMAVGDAAQGRENLRSLTLVPDHNALKAVEALGMVTYTARNSGEPVRFSESGTPAAERAGAASFARDVAAQAHENASTLAWNANGEMTVMPDVSRRLLATLGAYKLRPGDRLLEQPPAVREAILRDDWDTLLHEAHHSVTPAWDRESAATGIWEEAIPTVLAMRDRSLAARQAGADIAGIAADPASGRDDAALPWTGWNRSIYPKPSKEQQQETTATYVDGPAVLRDLLNLAGVDRRTTAGRERSIDLLQGAAAQYVPRRVADAIIAERGVDPSLRGRQVSRVRASLSHPDGVRHVEELLEQAR
jgi:hypothetical protein